MVNRYFKIVLFLLVGILILSSNIACLRARVPGQKQLPTVEPDAVSGPPAPVKAEVKIHEVPISAELEGKEYSFEPEARFTHIAIKADDSMEWPVKIWVSLNDEFLGFIYADGWEGEAPKKQLIGPGDLSRWVRLKGSWLTGVNLLKLKFITPSVGGMDIPSRYFKGTLYLKNDPEAVEEEQNEKPAQEKPAG
jgi:hypothetical protein